MKTLFYLSWGFLIALIVPGFYLWKIPFWIISAVVFDALLFNGSGTKHKQKEQSKITYNYTDYSEDNNSQGGLSEDSVFNIILGIAGIVIFILIFIFR